MKKLLTILSLIFVLSTAVFADDAVDKASEASRSSSESEIQDSVLSTTPVIVFGEKTSSGDRFGLKSDTGEVLVEPIFRKLIKIGNSAWICQKGNKFGLIDKSGVYLVDPKYRFADRIFGKYAKLGNGKDYGLYDEAGYAVIPPEYMSIEPLRGRMFLTNKNYKYGVVNLEGEELLPNIFDSLYMPERNKMHVKYRGQWYELGKLSKDQIELPDDVVRLTYNDREFTITKIVTNPAAASGYSVVSATNYFLKIFSAMLPSYEKTIDDLVYSQGADAVGILKNFSWIPKFPVTYAKNYYSNIKAPNTGPLSDLRDELKNYIK